MHSFSFPSLACFFLFPVLFFPPSSSCGDRHPLTNAASNWGKEQGRGGKRWASAAYRRDVNSSVDVERIRCSSKRERAPSLSLSLSHTHTPHLSRSLFHSLSLSLSVPVCLSLLPSCSLQCPEVVG